MVTQAESYILFAGKTSVIIDTLVNVADYYAEAHRVRVRKTNFPVESKASLTDHAVREPYVLRVTGIVSEVTHGSTDVAVAAWAALLKAANAFQLVTVVTRLGTYRNMLLTEIKAPVDATTGLSLDVDIELSEVLLANIQRGAGAALPQPTEGPAMDRQGDTVRGRVDSLPTVFDEDFLGGYF